jgi:hypothetical protein
MENSKKDEFTPILSDIIRMMVMTRLGLAKRKKTDTCNEYINKK